MRKMAKMKIHFISSQEPQRDFQQCGMCDHQSLRSACAYAQSDQSLCYSLESSTKVNLLNEHHLKCLSFKGGSTGLSESILVKMPHCWKSHVVGLINLSALQEL